MRLLFIGLVLLLSTFVYSHVPEGGGDSRQFYSYFTNNPPVINGCLTDKTTAEGTQGTHHAADANEWKDAYARHMKMGTIGGDTVSVTWFFMNDSDFLYVGFVANSNNLGNNQSINMVFDQGIGGGSHNDLLEGGGSGINNGEFRVNCEPTNLDINEYSFNGTTWVQQNNGSEVFLALGNNFGISFMQSEWKIPLKPINITDDNHSYLNLNPTDEVGLNIFYSTSSKGTFYWNGTNNSMTDPSSGNGWIDLRLGVNRDFVTFYGTFNANGNPVIDGNIDGGTAPDDAWRGGYFRNIVLTNFAGKTMNAMLYCVDDDAANYLYAGLKVFDNDNDANDSCIVYQEQSNLNTTDRNFILDNGMENAIIANTTAYVASRDRYWSGGASGSWAADASGANQNAAGAWRDTHYEYEYKINRNAATDDIELSDGGRMGFHIRYHDAEDGSDYFWELSPNADRIQIDWNNNIYVATGWADMQLGAPYFQVVYPEDNSYLEGVTNVRVYASKSAGDIDSASFYRKSLPVTKYRLTKIGSSNEWTGTWDVTSLPNGSDTLVFQVYDGTIVMDRIVNVIIKNDASAAVPSPSVAIALPAAGGSVAGIVNIAFSSSAAGGRVIDSTQISIDGAAFIPTTATTFHTWNTTLLVDGSHTVRIRVVDDIGSDSITATYSYVVHNTPSVSLISPIDSSAQSGKVMVRFAASVPVNAIIDSCEISVDNISWRKTVSDTCDTVNTALYSDGYHFVYVKAYSSGRTACSVPLRLNFVNSPSIVLNSPRADSVVRGTFAVLFTATAVSPAVVESTWISIDGAPYRVTSSHASDTIDTRALTDGDHIIQVKVMDDNGKVGVSGNLKVVVNNSPSIVLNSPRADSVVRGTFAVLFTATAVSPAVVESTWISIDGAPYRVTSSHASDTIDTRALTDGDHIIQVKVMDDNGKVGISGNLKVVVNNSPSIVLNSPRADSVVRGTFAVLFTASAVSPAVVESTWISIDGAPFRVTSSNTSDTVDTRALTDGDHIIQVKVMDDNGKVGVSGNLKVVVNNRPIITVNTPIADSRLSGTVVVSFSAAAVVPATIESTWISLDGGLYRATSTGSTDTIDTRLMAEGTHYFMIKAMDDNGKMVISEPRKFNINNLPVVTLTSPIAGSTLSGIDTLRFNAVAVAPAVIESTWISIDGGSYVPTTGSTFSVLNTVDLADGTHSVQVKAQDDNGKTDYSYRINFMSRNAPAVTITYPLAGQYVSGIVTVRFRATTVLPALLDSVEVSIDGGVYLPATTESTYVWNTTLLNDVDHTIKVRVKDDKDKSGESEILLVKADNRAPVISGAALDYGQFSALASNGRLTISALVFDRESDLLNSGVKLHIPALGQDSLVMNDAGSMGDTISGDHIYSVGLSPSDLAAGPIAYSVTAVDLLGNKFTVNDTFYFDAVPPSVSLSVLPKAVNGADDLNGSVFVDNIELAIHYNDAHSGLSAGSLLLSDSTGTIKYPESHIALPLSDSILLRTVYLKEGVNRISVTVTDRAGNSSSVNSYVKYIPPKVTATIGIEGGIVTNPNGTSISIPQGALFQPVSITIVRKEQKELPEPESNGIHLIGPAYEFGPDGLIFKKEVSLSFSYTSSDLDPDGDGVPNFPAESLAIYFLDNGKWIIAGDAITDTIRKRVEITANHFTIYAIGTRSASDSGKITGYWTKNPLLRSEQSTFIYSLPESGKISLAVYDVAGDLVRILIPEGTERQAGSYSVRWNGDNGSNRFCGTGLYLYLFKASTATEKKIVKKPVAIVNR